MHSRWWIAFIVMGVLLRVDPDVLTQYPPPLRRFTARENWKRKESTRKKGQFGQENEEHPNHRAVHMRLVHPTPFLSWHAYYWWSYE